MGEEGKSYTIHKSKKSQVDREMHARESLRKTLEDTSHRLDHVYELKGVEYISDTRSMDLLSTRDTFKCMLKPVIWLAITTPHERDYSLLEKYVKHKIKSIVVYGGNSEDMRGKLERFVEAFYAEENLKDAVSRTHKIANSGDAVIFSPSCVSQDDYNDFADRGSAFKRMIKTIAES